MYPDGLSWAGFLLRPRNFILVKMGLHRAVARSARCSAAARRRAYGRSYAGYAERRRRNERYAARYKAESAANAARAEARLHKKQARATQRGQVASALPGGGPLVWRVAVTANTVQVQTAIAGTIPLLDQLWGGANDSPVHRTGEVALLARHVPPSAYFARVVPKLSR